MRPFALTALAVAVAGCLLLASTGSAATPRDRQDPVVKWIIEDCVRDDRLQRDYPLGALRRALDALPRWVRRTTRCERVIERAIRRAENRLRRQVERILRDCSRDGKLDRRYDLDALWRALRRVGHDRRCEYEIRRAIRRFD